MSDPSIRCFLAVPVGERVREALARWLRTIRGRLPNARWVDPQHYHLTIKFFGEQPAAAVERLAAALAGGVAGFGAFEVEITGFGAFPGLDRPRVLWAGVGAGADDLRRLAGIVDAALVGRDIPADRRDFHPHLTLARFRVPARGRDLPPEVLQDLRRPWGRFEIDRVDLMQSRLTPNGAQYSILHSFPLRAPDPADS
ncbi:MAG TPA: RNA 2',3'-cyclic phosphodiesterase [Bacillota bacterium]